MPAVEEPAVRIEVGGAFWDPAGDALTYGVASSAPSVAAVTVLGSTVTVTPIGEGTATLTVTATDAGGANGTATQTFRATVRPAGARSFTDYPIVPGCNAGPDRPFPPTPRCGWTSAFTELRARIDALRSSGGLARFSWTEPELQVGVSRVRRVHLLELRSALTEAYRAAGRAAPRWTNAAPAAGGQPRSGRCR